MLISVSILLFFTQMARLRLTIRLKAGKNYKFCLYKAVSSVRYACRFVRRIMGLKNPKFHSRTRDNFKGANILFG